MRAGKFDRRICLSNIVDRIVFDVLDGDFEDDLVSSCPCDVLDRVTHFAIAD